MIPPRVFFVTTPDVATVTRIQRLVPTRDRGTATSVVVRANKSTIGSVFGILRPWPRFRALGICFPTRLAIGRAAVCGTFLSLMLQWSFCNIVDLCLRAQGVVKSEAASLSSQSEQFDHAGTKIELCQLQQTLQWHFGTRDVCCRQVCESVDKSMRQLATSTTSLRNLLK